MPILFMALIALAVFLGMGLLLFYAVYAEAHMPDNPQNPSSRETPGEEPDASRAAKA